MNETLESLKDNKTDDKMSPQARGRRVKRLRNMANLTRKMMCESNSLNVNTLKGWEVARYGGLTTNGAKKIIERVLKERVICSLDWLLYERGAAPRVILDGPETSQLSTDHNLHPDQDTLIIQELLFFQQQFPSAVYYQINDDGMLPYYQISDYVAGISYTGSQIEQVVNKACIVQVDGGVTLLRYVRKGEYPDTYTLVTTNVNTTVNKPTLYNVKLVSAAPVMRVLRKSEMKEPARAI